jgi:hypothetical protein
VVTVAATDPDGVAFPVINGCWCSGGPDQLLLAAGADRRKTVVVGVYDNLFSPTTVTSSC